MFAAFKIIVTCILAAISLLAAIAESTHPLLFACLIVAFIVGVFGAEMFRSYRSRTVRSQV